MTILLFAKITIVCLLGAMSPGPSMVVVINNAIYKNRINGILTAIGHGFGIGIYAFFAVLGIGLIIKTNLFLFNTIKILSIFFLFYLGFQAIFSNPKMNFEKNAIKFGVKSFLEGFAISILNPKILIWFLAIYSQFMSASNDYILNISLILIASSVDALWYIILVKLVTAKGVLEKLKSKLQLIQKLIGYLFITISIFLIIGLIR
jgi:threonine/homoserine/homoserine lactone efflux protein